jgi:hypothetical protein
MQQVVRVAADVRRERFVTSVPEMFEEAIE